MAPFPTLWQCLRCRSLITVNTDTGKNYRAPHGLTEIWCAGCKTWTSPVEPNGRAA